jgi:hypothetical protein
MKNLTPEIISKAKAAKSAEELLALAKANNVELTEEEAKTYFAQLNANNAVSDEELDAVAGGCGDDEENKGTTGVIKCNCPSCGRPVTRQITQCPHCNMYFSHSKVV